MTASATTNTPARRRFTTPTTLKSPPGCAFTSGVEVLQGVHEDLREGRERLDRVAQRADRDLCADRERCLLQPLAGLRSDRICADEHAAPSVGQQRQEAGQLGV